MSTMLKIELIGENDERTDVKCPPGIFFVLQPSLADNFQPPDSRPTTTVGVVRHPRVADVEYD